MTKYCLSTDNIHREERRHENMICTPHAGVQVQARERSAAKARRIPAHSFEVNAVRDAASSKLPTPAPRTRRWPDPLSIAGLRTRSWTLRWWASLQLRRSPSSCRHCSAHLRTARTRDRRRHGRARTTLARIPRGRRVCERNAPLAGIYHDSLRLGARAGTPARAPNVPFAQLQSLDRWQLLLCYLRKFWRKKTIRATK